MRRIDGKIHSPTLSSSLLAPISVDGLGDGRTAFTSVSNHSSAILAGSGNLRWPPTKTGAPKLKVTAIEEVEGPE